MSARRVGFGDDREKAPKARPRNADAKADAQVEKSSTAEGAKDGKQASRVARAFIALFLLVWLMIWTYALIEVSGMIGSSFVRGDWFGLGFAVVWVTFGGIGWVFAIVILFAILFGKNRDPGKPSLLLKRMAARRAARAADRNRWDRS